MARTKRISRWVVHLVSAYKGMCLFVISFLSKPKIKPFLPSGGTRTKLMELEPHWWRLSKLLQVLSSVNNSGQADDVFRPLSLSHEEASSPVTARRRWNQNPKPFLTPVVAASAKFELVNALETQLPSGGANRLGTSCFRGWKRV